VSLLIHLAPWRGDPTRWGVGGGDRNSPNKGTHIGKITESRSGQRHLTALRNFRIESAATVSRAPTAERVSATFRLQAGVCPGFG
jgi:hypothetical protein